MAQTLLHSTDLFNEHICCIQALSHSHTADYGYQVGRRCAMVHLTQTSGSVSHAHSAKVYCKAVTAMIPFMTDGFLPLHVLHLAHCFTVD